MIKHKYCINNRVTFDHGIRWVDCAPQVAALLAFLKVVSVNTGSSSVGWSNPSKVDAVLKGSDNLGC